MFGIFKKTKAAEPRYARVDEVQVGTVLIADGGFTCIKEGARLTVSDNNGLRVPCRHYGGHHLDGQLENGEYIGFTLAQAA